MPDQTHRVSDANDKAWDEVRLLLKSGFRPTAEGHWERRITKQEALWWGIAERIANGQFTETQSSSCECGQ